VLRAQLTGGVKRSIAAAIEPHDRAGLDVANRRAVTVNIGETFSVVRLSVGRAGRDLDAGLLNVPRR